jgi:phosphate transport system permease protein
MSFWSNTSATKDRPAGEPFVWFTGLGLALGLLMIVFLLGLIAYQGIGVFWPKPLAELEFREDRPTRFRGGSVVAGRMQMERNIDVRDLTPAQREAVDPRERREKQIYFANRDAYGTASAIFPVGDIARISYPLDLLYIERMTWGYTIAYPVAVLLANGTRLEAGDPAFDNTFKRIVDAAQDRRRLITRIERDQIGKINLQLRQLELDIRYYTGLAEPGPAEQQALERARARQQVLQAEFEPLRDRAAGLRREQQAEQLIHRLPTGEERVLPIGEIVHYYYPNRLTLPQKTGQFLYAIYDFLTGYPREANTLGGIFPAIFGTFVMTLLMSVAVTPFGVLAAIYLREYAKQGPMVRSVRIAINNLAGVPSIVFGIFGLGFFVYFMGGNIDRIFFPRALDANTPTFGTPGILWASLTLALMTVPVVIVATEEALAAVSRGVREGALACGASKWQTIQTLVLPASAPGILTGLILAMARGAGEVAPLMLVGVVALAPNLPLDTVFPFLHLERKFMHLGFHIYDLGFQSPDSEAAKPMVFATTLVLITLVVVLNLAAILIRNHLRKKYTAGAF